MTSSQDLITTITDKTLYDRVHEHLSRCDWANAGNIANDVVTLMKNEGWVHVVPHEPDGLGAVVLATSSASGLPHVRPFVRVTAGSVNPWRDVETGIGHDWLKLDVTEVLSPGVTEVLSRLEEGR